MNAIDLELEKIDAEMRTLEAIRARLYAVRDSGGPISDPAKVRRPRRKKAGLPSATMPAGEAKGLL